MTISNIMLVTAAVLTGLTAGLFYAWSCSVMLGAARLADREFVSFMQKTNLAIQNPVFFASFFGAPLSTIIATVLFYGDPLRFRLLLAASLLLSLGMFGVTVAGNVPLNDALDRFDLDPAGDAEISRVRQNFERRWTNLNHVRAAASTIALILSVIACLS